MSDMTVKKALVVEDEPAISVICRRVLEDEGFEVTAVGNGKDAEEAVAGCQYDILLVDIRLPVESGADFYTWLTREYPQIAQRVIFMTGGVMGGDTMELLHTSGRPYLLKPFRPDDLINTINAYLKE
jgi:DNA-binding response OmpR family regulator